MTSNVKLSDYAQGREVDVVVHFGAHKTATTFLQKYLKNASVDLRRKGVGYLSLDVCRATVMPYISKSSKLSGMMGNVNPGAMWHSIAEVSESVVASGEALRRLVISDENLAGPALAILNKSVLYPAASSRLRILVNQFPDVRVKLMVSIRDYADFIPSVYCELLRRQKLAPLSKMLDRHRNIVLSWPKYLGEIAAALPECDVLYWSYEDFIGSPADVVEAMTGVRMTSIEATISRKVRPSLTRKAVSVLQAARHHLTDEDHQRLAQCLADKMLFDGDSKLSIEDQSLSDGFRKRYRDDLAILHDMSEPVCGTVRRIRR